MCSEFNSPNSRICEYISDFANSPIGFRYCCNHFTDKGGSILFYKSYSSGIEGIEGYIVTVEADVSKGIPNFTLVGLPDATVKESKERIRSAILNSGLKFPNKKIVINLSPSSIKKEGSHYDLPIALSILSCEYKFLEERFNKTMFFGELSLDGRIQKAEGTIPYIIAAKESELIDKVVLPVDNSMEAEVVRGIEVYCSSSLKETVAYLMGSDELISLSARPQVSRSSSADDFSDVKGNLIAKRSAEICAAGYHNLLMIGPPGSGKSMIAKRIPGIMTSLDEDEYIQVSKIYSSIGKFNENILHRIRPFRSPHHTATMKAIIGGGQNSSPGEVVLAHKGVLFIDELLEFEKKTLEALRQPIEDKYVNISRIKHSYRYPCDFVLVAATNPCPCGNYLNPFKECICSQYQIQNYLSRASSPLLDRFDLFAEMLPIDFDEIHTETREESSKEIFERIRKAIELQKHRYKKEDFSYNSLIPAQKIPIYCSLGEKETYFLKSAFEKFNFSLRSYHKVLRVARTIADLDAEEKISLVHLSEAVSFRKPLIKYWR